MKKTDFIALVASKADMTKKDAEKALDAVMSAVEDVLAEGDKLQLVGFGSFETKARPERIGRNPKSGEPMKIEAAVIPVFKPGKQLRDRVNGEA
ncbi:MAG: HU family DNA-binding protein [Intestinibacillus sp.]